MCHLTARKFETKYAPFEEDGRLYEESFNGTERSYDGILIGIVPLSA